MNKEAELRALECCIYDNCENCPYNDLYDKENNDATDCMTKLMEIAKSIIESM